MFLQLLFLLLLLFLSLFSFNPCNSNTVNGTGLKLAHKSGTITGRAVACYVLPQAIHYNGGIFMCITG